MLLAVAGNGILSAGPFRPPAMKTQIFWKLLCRWIGAPVLATVASAQSILWEVIGPEPHSSLSGTGFPGKLDAGEDVDGDGIPDVVAGAWSACESFGNCQGRVYVYSGLNGSIIHAIDGVVPNEGVGLANQLCGDWNGDERSEFAASTFGGPVYVFSGIDGSLLRTIAPPASWPCESWQPLAASDLDGDGRTDLVLGCPAGIPPDPFGSGAAAAVSGVDGSILWLAVGTSYVDRFGYAIAGAGDHDGDAIEDFVVGAPAWWEVDIVMWQEWGKVSYAWLLSGASGAVLHTYFPDPVPDDPGDQNPRFGWSVSGGGDVDGDGLPDVVIGETKKHVDTQGHVVFSGQTTATLHETHDGSGYTVRHLADVDGDGFDDYLASGYGWPLVIAGGDFATIYSLNVNQPFALGSYAAAAGDVDGDDFPDVAIADDSFQLDAFGLPLKIQGRIIGSDHDVRAHPQGGSRRSA